MMWFAVCWYTPQSQAGLLDTQHLHISALKRSTSVRSLLSLTQACRGMSDPGQHLDRETFYSRSLLVDGCHSADHILPNQWAFVSLGRAGDRRSFQFVANRRQDFSLGCVPSQVMVWRKRWSWSIARRARARLAARQRSFAGGMLASTAALLVSVVSIHWLHKSFCNKHKISVIYLTKGRATCFMLPKSCKTMIFFSCS